jgi:hypothetical protein
LFESLAGRYDLARHDTRRKRDCDIAGGRFRQSAGDGADDATPFWRCSISPGKPQKEIGAFLTS